MRYGNPQALLDAIPRLRSETVRMPGALSNAFYFDAAIDALFVKPSIALGEFFSRVIDPHVIDAGVREASISANWLGHLFRSFQTGLVRAYALALAFGAACFALYYVVIGAGR
jgi:NADH:ubiquinone oxidoreductase subunit 5 (subunit L)/multisubunit Na+/H+ antiporter MnhA subunit